MAWVPEIITPREKDSERQPLIQDWLDFAQRLDWSEPHHQHSELLAFTMLQKIMRALSLEHKP